MATSVVGSDGPLVDFRGVSKSYGPQVALDGMDLRVDRGELFGFIGPNGAGKTTTIKVMIGLLTEFGGRVSIAGKAMPSHRREVHRDLGYLPQHVAFQEWRTVEQVLTTFGRLSGLTGGDLEEGMERALSLLEVQHLRDRRVTKLSGGEHQKVGMAQAILHRPALLVLDEPMVGLDPESRFRFKEVMQRLHREGTTILFSSHILSDVQDVATRIGIINHGRVLWTGTIPELKEHFSMSNDFQIILSREGGRWKEAEELEGVLSVSEVGAGILLAQLDGSMDVDLVADRLLRGLLERDCHVRSFYPVSPTLEQLYIRFVSEDRPGGEGP
jgi:ABC-2 type transport system ATP-binding protein